MAAKAPPAPTRAGRNAPCRDSPRPAPAAPAPSKPCRSCCGPPARTLQAPQQKWSHAPHPPSRPHYSRFHPQTRQSRAGPPAQSGSPGPAAQPLHPTRACCRQENASSPARGISSSSILQPSHAKPWHTLTNCFYSGNRQMHCRPRSLMNVGPFPPHKSFQQTDM